MNVFLKRCALDLAVLAMIGLAWLSPAFVWVNGYDWIISGVVWLGAVMLLPMLMSLAFAVSWPVRWLSLATIYAGAAVSVLSIMFGFCIMMPGIATFFASGGQLFVRGGDFGTMLIVYCLPAGLMIFPAYRFMKELEA